MLSHREKSILRQHDKEPQHNDKIYHFLLNRFPTLSNPDQIIFSYIHPSIISLLLVLSVGCVTVFFMLLFYCFLFPVSLFFVFFVEAHNRPNPTVETVQPTNPNPSKP